MKADITFEQVSAPANEWCASGHHAHGTFKRNGPNSEPESIRFFRVKGQGINAIYCEPCLCIANYVGSIKRKIRKGQDDL